MKLEELDAKFIGDYSPTSHSTLPSMEGAQGVQFQCPACSRAKERGRGFVIGAHYILCWFEGSVPNNAIPGPGRWTPSGKNIDTLSLSPSVQIDCWHGYVRNGNAD